MMCNDLMCTYMQVKGQLSLAHNIPKKKTKNAEIREVSQAGGR